MISVTLTNSETFSGCRNAAFQKQVELNSGLGQWKTSHKTLENVLTAERNMKKKIRSPVS